MGRVKLFLAVLLGTATFASAQPVPSPDRIPCRAQYMSLTPYEMVGMDECGHLWKLILPHAARPMPVDSTNVDALEATMGKNDTDEPLCMFWDLTDGNYHQIPCPAPGSINGYIEPEPNRGVR